MSILPSEFVFYVLVNQGEYSIYSSKSIPTVFANSWHSQDFIVKPYFNTFVSMCDF